MEASTIYQDRLKGRDTELQSLEARIRAISTVRIVVALGALGLVGTIVWGHGPEALWWGVGLLLVVFVALVFVHSAAFAAKERVAASKRFYERGLARLQGQWQHFPREGTRFRGADHPYVDDLDIFGRGSLFTLLDGTETRYGEECLSGLLLGRGTLEGASEAFPQNVEARQKAVQELSRNLDLRERLSSIGAVVGAERPDPGGFLAWAEGTSKHAVVTEPGSSLGLRVVAFVLPALTLLLGLTIHLTSLPRSVFLLLYLADMAIIFSLNARVSDAVGAVGAQENQFVRFADMLREVEAARFESARLQALQARLRESGAAATEEMKALSRIVGFFEARNNEVFRFFIGPFLLWDVHCVLALEGWRHRAGARCRGWLEALGEVEALASLATFAFENPRYAWPELVTEPCYEADDLGHPLLPSTKRVCNDVRLPQAGCAYIVTGSNMSGKSTMLRSLGINGVLALAGAPVCARRFKMGPVQIATSMRIRDSLEQGVSHFYAEVAKLKAVLDLAAGPRKVLFLLDEILHGTNSRERLIGARAVVRELLRLQGLGAVSTHDIGIGDLEQELAGKVKNVHFQEQVEGDRMTFDYKLRMGVVTSSNALRLMRMVGINVVPLDPNDEEVRAS